MMKKVLLVFLFAMGAVMLTSGVVPAAPITLHGLTFTEASPAITITGGIAGLGTLASPIVLKEDVFGIDVTMSIAGLPTWDPILNPTGSGHTAGFWLQKEVTNKTGAAWNFYDHELQEILGIPSPNDDGLSFAQGYAGGRPWFSDLLPAVDEILDVRDYINFSGGIVGINQKVIFRYIITDNTPIKMFYLRQRPNFQSGVPEPATMLLLGTGLVGLAGFGRKKLFKK